MRVVKAFAREQRQLERFRDTVGRVFSQAMVATRLEATYNPAIGFLPQLGLAAVLLLGGEAVIHAHLDARPVHGVLPLREHAHHADALARRDAQPRPARDRIRRAHLPAARPRAAPQRRPGRARAARGQRARAAARRDAALRGPARRARRERSRGHRPRGAAERARGAARHRPRRACRAHRRARGADRLGQDEPRRVDLAAV